MLSVVLVLFLLDLYFVSGPRSRALDSCLMSMPLTVIDIY